MMSGRQSHGLASAVTTETAGGPSPDGRSVARGWWLMVVVVIVASAALCFVVARGEQFTTEHRAAAAWTALLVVTALGIVAHVFLLWHESRLPATSRAERDHPTLAFRRRGLKAAVIGQDGRASTSKTQAVLWIVAVLWALADQLLLTKSYPGGNLFTSAISNNWRAEYLFLLGLPVAVAITAKAVVASANSRHGPATSDTSSMIVTKAKIDRVYVRDLVSSGVRGFLAGVAEQFTGDDDIVSWADLQYVVFTLITLVYFASQFLTQHAAGLPTVPAALCTLMGVSAAGYTANKVVSAKGTVPQKPLQPQLNKSQSSTGASTLLYQVGSSRGGGVEVDQGTDQPRSTPGSRPTTRRIGPDLADPRDAPSNRGPLVRRAVAAGAACAAAAGSGVVAALEGAVVSLSLAISLGVLTATMLAFEGAVRISDRRSQPGNGAPRYQAPAGLGHPAEAAKDPPTAPEHQPRHAPPARVIEPDTPRPARRHLVGTVDSEVEPEQRFVLSLQVKTVVPQAMPGQGQSILPVDMLEGELVAIITMDAPFKVIGPAEVRIPVPRKGDGPECGFMLKADAAGEAEIRVDVHLGVELLGILRFKVSAIVRAHTGQSQSGKIDIPKVQLTRGLVKVQFIPGGKGNQLIQLVAGDTFYQARPLNIDETVLNQELLNITAKLNAMGEGIAPGSLGTKRLELYGIGRKLFKLLPPDFLSEFVQRSTEAESLGIEGDSRLPWELMADSNDISFLSERLRISRWFHGHDPVSLIQVRKAIFAYSERVTNSKTEVEKIGALLHPDQEPTCVAEPEELYERLRAGDFDLFHFAGHTADNDLSSRGSLELSDNKAFTLDLMEAVPDGSMRRFRPVIFLNACASADTGGGQTLFDRWASAFIKRGAGAFIGSLWNIRSVTAHKFGVELYKSVQAGEATTLGQAVDLARKRSVGDPSDPTRLAYALYGKDDAHIRLGS